MPTCEACGSPNSEGTLVCQACGSQLRAGALRTAPAAPVIPLRPAQPGAGAVSAAPAAGVAGAAPILPSRLIVHKSLLAARALEIFPGLFGVFGLGRLYAGDQNAAIWLVIGLAWMAISFVINISTLLMATLCILPINLVISILSLYSLDRYVKQHPEIYG